MLGPSNVLTCTHLKLLAGNCFVVRGSNWLGIQESLRSISVALETGWGMFLASPDRLF